MLMLRYLQGTGSKVLHTHSYMFFVDMIILVKPKHLFELYKLRENQTIKHKSQTGVGCFTFFWRAESCAESGTGKLGRTSFWRNLEAGNLADLLCRKGGRNRGPDRFWMVFCVQCWMQQWVGLWKKWMLFILLFDWFIEFEWDDDVWIVCIFSNISVLEFSEGVILGSSSLSQKLGSWVLFMRIYGHTQLSRIEEKWRFMIIKENSIYAWQDKMDGTDRHRLPWSVLSMPSFVSSFYLSDLVTSTSGGALQVYLDFCQRSKVWHTISEGWQSMNMPGSHDEVEIKVWKNERIV